MAINFKKALLTGSALVAVCASYPGAAHAIGVSIDYNDVTCCTGGIANGDHLLGDVAAGRRMGLNLGGTIMRLGTAGAQDAITVTKAANWLYVASGAGSESTLVLEGQNSAINAGTHDFRIHLGQYRDGTTSQHNTHLLINHNIVTSGAGSVNIDSISRPGNKVTFAGNAHSINMGAGETRLSNFGGKQDVLIFDGNAAQEYTGRITGDGKIKIANAHTGGVVFNGDVTAKTLELTETGAQASFKGNLTVTDQVTISAGRTIAFGGTTFAATGGVKLDAPGATLLFNGTGNQTLNGGISGDNGVVEIATTGGIVDITGNANFKTVELSSADAHIKFSGTSTFLNNIRSSIPASDVLNGSQKLTFSGSGVDIAGGLVILSADNEIHFDGTALQNISASFTSPGVTPLYGKLVISNSSANGVNFSANRSISMHTLDMKQNAKVNFSGTTSFNTLSLAGGNAITSSTLTPLSAVNINSAGVGNHIAWNANITGHTKIDSGDLKFSENASALNSVEIGDNAALVFTHSGVDANATTINGAVTGGANSVLRNGVGTLRLAGGSIGVQTIEYTDVGLVEVTAANSTINNVNFAGHDGTLRMRGTIQGNVATGADQNGTIVSTGNLSFDGTVGGENAALKQLTLGGQALFNGVSHIKAVSAGAHDMIFRAAATITDGLSTTGTISLENVGSGNVVLSAGGDGVSAGNLTNLSGDNRLASKTVVNGATTVQNDSTLTFAVADSRLNTANIGSAARLAFTHQTGSAEITGNVTGDGTLENGAGTLTLGGTANTVSQIDYTGAGTININAGTSLDSAVSFNEHDGLLNLGNSVTNVTKAITAISAGGSAGRVTTGTGDIVFGARVGTEINRLNNVTLGGNARFDAGLHTDTLNAAGREVEFRGNSTINQAWVADHVRLSGSSLGGTGAGTFGALTNIDGENTISNKIEVSGVTTITDGHLEISHTESKLGAVALGNKAMTFAGTHIGAVEGQNGTLGLSGANTQVASIGTSAARLTAVTFTGAQTTIAGDIYAATLNITGGNVTANGGVLNTTVIIDGDHTMRIANATELTGGIIALTDDQGVVEFSPNFTKINGGITGRLKSISLAGDMNVVANMSAAKTTNIGAHKLDVGGTFTADEHSTLAFTVDGATSGQIVAGDAVTIHEDTTVTITVANVSGLNNGNKITLIDGTGGAGVATLKTGKLQTLNTALLSFAQDTANKEDLVVVVNRASTGETVTGDNNKTVGTVLDRMGANLNDPDIKAFEARLLSAQSVDELNALIESIQPDMSGGTVAAAVNVSGQTSAMINHRVSTVRSGDNSGSGIATGNGWADTHMWAQAFGARADQGQRGFTAGYDADTYGFVGGVDGDVSDHMHLGIALSYANTDVKAKDVNRSTSDMDSWQIAAYGDYDLGNDYFMAGQLGYIYSDIEAKRFNVGGVPGNTASASYHNSQYVARGEFGRILHLQNNASLTPSVMVNYNYVDVGDYDETGAGGLGLRNVSTDAMQILELGANLVAEVSFDDGMGGTITPTLHGGYRYDVIGDDIATSAHFAGGGAAFTVKGADPARGTFNIGGGFKWDMSSNVYLSAQYDFQTKSDYREHSGSVRAGYRF